MNEEDIFKDGIISSENPELLFNLVELLGEGSYGRVYKAVDVSSSKNYAIKIVNTQTGDLANLKREICILRDCSSELIVKYYGSYLHHEQLWLVMEYCEVGSVNDLMKATQRTLREPHIACIIKSVLQGLMYMHNSKKIHRDIKAGNILINKQGHVKLADFGVSAELLNTLGYIESFIGTPFWMSPEILSKSKYNKKTDIWSLGITAIEMAEGEPPYSNLSPFKAIIEISKQPPKQLTHPQKWSSDFNSFVQLCLTVDPEKRPNAQDLLLHPFITAHTQKGAAETIMTNLVLENMGNIRIYRRQLLEKMAQRQKQANNNLKQEQQQQIDKKEEEEMKKMENKQKLQQDNQEQHKFQGQQVQQQKQQQQNKEKIDVQGKVNKPMRLTTEASCDFQNEFVINESGTIREYQNCEMLSESSNQFPQFYSKNDCAAIWENETGTMVQKDHQDDEDGDDDDGTVDSKEHIQENLPSQHQFLPAHNLLQTEKVPSSSQQQQQKELKATQQYPSPQQKYHLPSPQGILSPGQQNIQTTQQVVSPKQQPSQQIQQVLQHFEAKQSNKTTREASNVSQNYSRMSISPEEEILKELATLDVEGIKQKMQEIKAEFEEELKKTQEKYLKRIAICQGALEAAEKKNTRSFHEPASPLKGAYQNTQGIISSPYSPAGGNKITGIMNINTNLNGTYSDLPLPATPKNKETTGQNNDKCAFGVMTQPANSTSNQASFFSNCFKSNNNNQNSNNYQPVITGNGIYQEDVISQIRKQFAQTNNIQNQNGFDQSQQQQPPRQAAMHPIAFLNKANNNNSNLNSQAEQSRVNFAAGAGLTFDEALSRKQVFKNTSVKQLDENTIYYEQLRQQQLQQQQLQGLGSKNQLSSKIQDLKNVSNVCYTSQGNSNQDISSNVLQQRPSNTNIRLNGGNCNSNSNRQQLPQQYNPIERTQTEQSHLEYANKKSNKSNIAITTPSTAQIDLNSHMSKFIPSNNYLSSNVLSSSNHSSVSNPNIHSKTPGSSKQNSQNSFMNSSSNSTSISRPLSNNHNNSQPLEGSTAQLSNYSSNNSKSQIDHQVKLSLIHQQQQQYLQLQQETKLNSKINPSLLLTKSNKLSNPRNIPSNVHQIDEEIKFQHSKQTNLGLVSKKLTNINNTPLVGQKESIRSPNSIVQQINPQQQHSASQSQLKQQSSQQQYSSQHFQQQQQQQPLGISFKQFLNQQNERKPMNS